MGTRDKSNVDYMPTVADVARNPSDGSRARRPYEAPIARRGSERNRFCLRGLNLRYEFWERVTLRGHPQEAQLLSGLKGGASAFEFLTEEYQGTAVQSRTGRTRPRRVRTVGIAALLYHGRPVEWADVRGPTVPARSRLVLPISVESAKFRLVIDARARNEYCRRVSLRTDTVDVAAEEIYTGNMHDRSEFHNLSL